MTPQQEAEAIRNLIERVTIFRAGIAQCAHGRAVPGLLAHADKVVADAEQRLAVLGYKIRRREPTAVPSTTVQ
jgi:hypothetical protein